MVTVSPLVRRAAATTLLLAAGLAAIAAYPHTYDLMARADTGWWAPLEVIATDGLLLGNGLVLLTTATCVWSAWLTVALGVPVNVAVVFAASEPWMAWLVGLWPAVLVALGSVTFVRNRRQLNIRQEEDQ